MHVDVFIHTKNNFKPCKKGDIIQFLQDIALPTPKFYDGYDVFYGNCETLAIIINDSISLEEIEHIGSRIWDYEEDGKHKEIEMSFIQFSLARLINDEIYFAIPNNPIHGMYKIL